MAEIKNNFVQGKMNKDLDKRLIPKGEYREAQNILINESEGSNIGVMESIKGNAVPYADHLRYVITKVTEQAITGNYTESSVNVTLSGTNTLIKVGQVVKAYNGDTILESTGMPTGDSYTVASINGTALVLNFPVDFSTTEPTKLVFCSPNVKVIGHSTDIKNKRIAFFVTDYVATTSSAVRSMVYPDKSAVCKIILYTPSIQGIDILVEGNFLNFNKNDRIIGVNIIDDLLFWTDNRNQPRKINIARGLADPTHYQFEEQISVAKVAPYAPISLVDSSGATVLTRDSSIRSEYLRYNFVRFSYRYKYEDGEYSTIAPFTQIVFEPLNTGTISDTVNAKNTTSGEPTVPIDKKDIYKRTTVELMQNRINQAELRIPLPSIDERITTGSTWVNNLKITNIEVLIKESDGIAVKVVKDIKIKTDSDFTGKIEQYTIKPKSSGSDTYRRYHYKHMYRSEKPFRTLTPDQVTRVFDQVPLRAKAQEISGNRVIYGNYMENYPYPLDVGGNKGINYTINSTPKGDHEHNTGGNLFNYGFLQQLEKQYKYHSIKQRRTYQVGVILADRFGRQSPVLLSTNVDPNEKVKDTYTVPAKTTDFSHYYNSASHSWSSERDGIRGLSLDITFKDDKILDDGDIFTKSAHIAQAGSAYDVGSSYNPYGWYSWRLVIKQSEQEYYNVYTSHAADGWNNIDSKRDNTLAGRSWLSLYSDNINKIPRDVREIDSTREGVSGSRVRLFPKVVSNATGGSVIQNQNATDLIDVISLGTAKDQNLFFTDSDNAGVGGFNVLGFVYGKDKNPLLAELPNMKHLGAYNSGVDNIAGAIGVVAITNTVGSTDSSGLKINSPLPIPSGVTAAGKGVTAALATTTNGDGTGATVYVYSATDSSNITKAVAAVGGIGYAAGDTLTVTEAAIESDGSIGLVSGDLTMTLRELDLLTQNDESYVILTSNVEAKIGGVGDLDDYRISGANVKLSDGEECKVGEYYEGTNKVVFADDINQSLTKGDKLFFTKYYEGLSVYETEPVESQLDIYYETSTGGLIKDLNERVSEGSEGPTNIAINTNVIPENSPSGTTTIGTLSATGVGALVAGTVATARYNTISSGASNTGTHSGIPGTTSGFTTDGDGTGAQVNVVVSGGAVTSVTITSGTQGKGYAVGDVITITSAVIGGSTNLVITLTSAEINTVFDWDKISFIDGLGVDVTDKVTVSDVGVVKTSGLFAYACDVRDNHTLKVKVTELNLYQSSKEIAINVTNSAPEFVSPSLDTVTTIAPTQPANYSLFQFGMGNGAKLTSEMLSGLVVSHDFYNHTDFNSLFETSVSGGLVTFKTTSEWESGSSAADFFSANSGGENNAWRRVRFTLEDLDASGELKLGSGELTSSANTISSGATEGTHTGTVGVTTHFTTNSANGSGAVIQVIVNSSGAVTTVTATTAGTGYEAGETITIASGAIGGSTNLVITLTTGDLRHLTTVNVIPIPGSNSTQDYVQINEAQNVISGNLINVTNQPCASGYTENTYYVTRGSNSTDPTVMGGWIQLRQNDIVWNDSNAQTAPTGFFRFVEYSTEYVKYGYQSGENGIGTIATCS